MILNTPKLAAAAKREHVVATTELIDALEEAAAAMHLSATEGLPILERLAERWPHKFTECRDMLREHAERERKAEQINAELAALKAEIEAEKKTTNSE